MSSINRVIEQFKDGEISLLELLAMCENYALKEGQQQSAAAFDAIRTALLHGLPTAFGGAVNIHAHGCSLVLENSTSATTADRLVCWPDSSQPQFVVLRDEISDSKSPRLLSVVDLGAVVDVFDVSAEDVLGDAA